MTATFWSCYLSTGARPEPGLRLAGFFGALAAAPFVATTLSLTGGLLVGFLDPIGPAFAIISLFALGAGLWTYLLFGAPLFALVALVSNGGLLLGAAAGYAAIFLAAQFGATDTVAEMGQVFAPLWGAVFGWLYRLIVTS